MRYLSILAILFLISCGRPVVYEKFENIQTAHIDASLQDSIKKNFNVLDIGSTSGFLGGLNPAYPIERVSRDCTEWCEKGWESGGMFCECRSYVIIQDGKPKLIKSKEGLKETFAPIDSYREALSYVIMVTGNFPVLNADYFKNERFTYLISNLRPTHVIETPEGFYVTLFDYKKFGCGEHPYYSVTYLVTTDGQVKEISRRKAFKDPTEDALCVD